MADPELLRWRLEAAEASCGSSNDQTYLAIEEALRDRQLDGCILDYGAGIGNLSKRLLSRKQFKNIYATDIIDRPEKLDAGVTWIKQDLNNPIDGYDSYFDVIVAAEVIEHLENPRAMARDLFRLCRSGGWVILSTPNNESVRALISLMIRGHYVSFNDSCYPAHITALLRKDLSRILREAGFGSPTFRFTAEGSLPVFTWLTWQGCSGGLLRGVRFSDGLLALAQKPL